jgi:hypothetical protein
LPRCHAFSRSTRCHSIAKHSQAGIPVQTNGFVSARFERPRAHTALLPAIRRQEVSAGPAAQGRREVCSARRSARLEYHDSSSACVHFVHCARYIKRERPSPSAHLSCDLRRLCACRLFQPSRPDARDGRDREVEYGRPPTGGPGRSDSGKNASRNPPHLTGGSFG